MRSRLRGETGSVVATAILVMAAMLALGLGIFALVDGQQAQAKRERVRESAFDVAEAALNSASAFVAMPGKWPTAASPLTLCTDASTSTACPDPASVRGGLATAETTGATWKISARDNGTGIYYSDSETAGQPAYDAAGDGMWIRSEATVGGTTRVLVQLVSRETRPELFPQNAVSAGFFATANAGKKQFLSSSAGISVRCTTGPTSSCLNYYPAKGQIGTTPVLMGYSGSLDAGLLSRLRQEAQNAGTYYASCPSSFTGTVVFIESGNCSGGSTYNSKAAPGAVVMASGTFAMIGSGTYYGLVYHACGQNPGSYTSVVTVSGSAQISGSIYIEGANCGVTLGSAGKTSLVYDANVTASVATHGPVRATPNTWRQVK
jgi:Tfp pilus assembly protein PilX